MAKLILMGDINLMDVTNPAEPFRKILGELHTADVAETVNTKSH